jgi:hypothetical protein
MERGFWVITNVVAFYPQVKATGLNEILGIFGYPGPMYDVHKSSSVIALIVNTLWQRRK